MGKVRVDTGNGKHVGAGCGARVDLACTCTNECVGCYAKYTTFLGYKKFHSELKPFTYTEAGFRASVRNAVQKKNVKLARCGMHCDPGLQPEMLLNVLRVATEGGLKLIVATKSLQYDSDIAAELSAGGHLLQITLGMITKNAPSTEDRYTTGLMYETAGVDVTFRVTADMTVGPDEFWNGVLSACGSKVILTLMRFRSYAELEVYKADRELYTYNKAYLRPDIIDAGWMEYKAGVCGDVGGLTYCVDCNVYGGKQRVMSKEPKGDIFKKKKMKVA